MLRCIICCTPFCSHKIEALFLVLYRDSFIYWLLVFIIIIFFVFFPSNLCWDQTAYGVFFFPSLLVMAWMFFLGKFVNILIKYSGSENLVY